MAKYIKQEMPDLQKTGNNKCYYRLENAGNIDTDKFLDSIASHGGCCLTKGTLRNVMTDIATELAYWLADGYTVSLEGIGTFNATIGLEKGLEMDDIDSPGPKHNARKLEVKNVEYRSDKGLVRSVARQCTLEKAGTRRVNRCPYTKEQRLQLLQKYLTESDHGFITAQNYAIMVKLPRSTGAKEIKEFARHTSETCIGWEGSRTHKVYVYVKPSIPPSV